MTSILDAGRLDDFRDLHVDQIDPAWKDKKLWIRAGLEALGLATSLRNRGRLPVDVALVFSLRAGGKPTSMHVRTLAGLRRELDWSPPSLLLLKPGEKPWAHGGSALKRCARPFSELVAKELEPGALGVDAPTKASYFIEFRPAGSGEYARTFLLVG